MAVYRFFFAPVVLATAVVLAHGRAARAPVAAATLRPDPQRAPMVVPAAAPSPPESAPPAGGQPRPAGGARAARGFH
jgi:hypothetical protein